MLLRCGFSHRGNVRNGWKADVRSKSLGPRAQTPVSDDRRNVVEAKLEVTVGEPCAAQDGRRVAVPLVGSVVQPADPSGPRVQINCVDVVSVGDDGLIGEVLVFWGLSDVAV